jgi:hypothetical protein
MAKYSVHMQDIGSVCGEIVDKLGRRGRQLPAKLWGFVDLTMIPQNGIRIAG